MGLWRTSGTRVRSAASGLRRTWSAVAPSPAAWRGATAGVVVVTAGLWLWFSLDLVTPASLREPLLVALGGVAAAAALGAVAALVVRLIPFLDVPSHVVWAVVAALPLLNLMTRIGLSSTAQLLLALLVVGAAALAGGSLATLWIRGWRARSPAGRAAVAASLAVGGGMLLAGAAVLAWDGPAGDREPALPAAQARARALNLPDPFAPGAFRVRSLTYGAGTDRHRPEYASGAALRTRPVDGSRLLAGWSGIGGRARTAFWGFGPSELPLNGRVWYPDARGRFPLVVVVHGDHHASDFSDPGYAYLGRRLASRGYVVVSVDENFLNSSVGDLSAIGVSRFGLDDEVGARAWLLLEHLRVWRAWDRRSGNRFFHRVDTGDVGIVGHSRGGEAAALAAVFNRMRALPGDRAQRFDYGFGIRAVAALAPTDDSYRPGGRPARLRRVDYLTLAGSQDADVLSFVGTNQYHRTTVPPGGFKSAIYVHRANHGQFNTTWGRYDTGFGAGRRLVNTATMLEPAEQRRVAGVFVSAFLDAALKGRRGYVRMLREPGAGDEWLPDTVYVKQFGDAATRYVSTSDDDRDRRTATAPRGVESGRGLTDWHEEGVPLRAGASADRAVVLGWDAGAAGRRPSYAIDLPPGAARAGTRGELLFSLADLGAAPRPVDLTVEVTDRDGDAARLPLSRDARLEPEFAVPRLKLGAAQAAALGEPVFQTFALPLAAYAAANPAFDPSAIGQIRFVFDRTRAGRVLLDDVGIRARAL